MKLVHGTLGAALLSGLATADMYFQFPGGSNNRLNEESRDVQNANRLFDSQNNNRFGHNQHSHYFLTGSEMDLQWTVQHSCGPDSNAKCDIVLQYACENDLRDGEKETTIPNRSKNCKDKNCNTDKRFGMHEPYEYYQHCALRKRNKRLFPADRKLRGDSARYTRQEEQGTRYGYECNEERDYYPYWHPTIWKDIVVFTDDQDRCKNIYQKESENVKGRWYCKVPQDWMDDKYSPNKKKAYIGLDRKSCEELGRKYRIRTSWVQSPAHNLPAPECREAPYSRDNHHGNAQGRQFSGYKWTVPQDLVHEKCSIRIRYNITSTDYDGWATTIDHTIDRRNKNYGVDMWSQYNWSNKTARSRGWRHKNDSPIQIFDDMDFKMKMAYNTDQLARVFEDRTHVLSFQKASPAIQRAQKAGKRVINLNARGKIGNFVEVYPAFEYDFVPSRIEAKVGDFIHVQWSGSDSNNKRNDGSQVDGDGRTDRDARQKDRHNMVRVDDMDDVWPSDEVEKVGSLFGLSKEDSMKLALDGVSSREGYLEGSKAYLDLGPKELTEAGKWMFMSSHNNQFGVRSQKGKVIVN